MSKQLSTVTKSDEVSAQVVIAATMLNKINLKLHSMKNKLYEILTPQELTILKLTKSNVRNSNIEDLTVSELESLYYVLYDDKTNGTYKCLSVLKELLSR